MVNFGSSSRLPFLIRRLRFLASKPFLENAYILQVLKLHCRQKGMMQYRRYALTNYAEVSRLSFPILNTGAPKVLLVGATSCLCYSRHLPLLHEWFRCQSLAGRRLRTARFRSTRERLSVHRDALANLWRTFLHVSSERTRGKDFSVNPLHAWSLSWNIHWELCIGAPLIQDNHRICPSRLDRRLRVGLLPGLHCLSSGRISELI